MIHEDKTLGTRYRLLAGDCLDRLREMDDSSVDAIVTDPPYGLAFMGKRWDYDVPSVDIWRECLRVLKPGGHMLAFGGTRTYHRMVVAIEDGGFEIRDQLAWVYGSGFPKSLNISKAIDKMNGDERPVIGLNPNNRDRSKHQYNSVGNVGSNAQITSAASAVWEGYGTALKPALEPICLARKPISEKNVAANVLKWGTGGLNIDASRIETEANPKNGVKNPGMRQSESGFGGGMRTDYHSQGRFPANLLLDEQAALALDEQSGPLKSGQRAAGVRKGMGFHGADGDGGPAITANQGAASRFFYVAKASKSERNAGLELNSVSARSLDGDTGKSSFASEFDEATWKKVNANFHPTVKPTKLMSYLCRLITPPGGLILDPFAGSGSTGVAALREGFKFIGIEREPEYLKIAEARIAAAEPAQPGLWSTK